MFLHCLVRMLHCLMHGHDAIFYSIKRKRFLHDCLFFGVYKCLKVIYIYVYLLFENICHVTQKIKSSLSSNPERPLTVPQGRKLTMSAEDEDSLRTFCDDAWHMGMPRTQDMLSEDIRDFAVRKDVPCPYKFRGPGKFAKYAS